jgi:ribosomal-protein-alanine N-acetyltransferase
LAVETPDTTIPAFETPITIRRMRASDIEHVSRIERESFSTGWSASAYLTELSNPAAVYIVAAVNEKLIGYGGLWVIMDEAHITTIAVVPEWRSLRIGERLLSEMLATARRDGATRATLEVRTSNEPAQRLYKRYGFLKAAVRKGYYSDNREDADILWLNDMDAMAWREEFNRRREEMGMPPL